MITLVEFSNEKLKKLKSINRILSIAAIIWFSILILDIIFSGYYIARGDLFKTVIYYLFPVTLYVIVILTFYSSHGILENKNYKSLLLFFIIQLLGFLLYNDVKIEIPFYFIQHKFLSIIIVAGVFVLIFAIIFSLLKDKHIEELIDKVNQQDIDQSISDLKSLTYSKSFSNLGLVVSAIFSILVITLVNIRTINVDLQYIISFGVLLGLLLVALISRNEQTVLAMLSFLDPIGAKYLFTLKSIKDKSDFELVKLKDESEVQNIKTEILQQKTQLGKDYYRARLQSLIAEMDSLKNEEMFNIFESDLKEKIQQFKDMSPRQKFLFLTNFEENIKKLKTQDLAGMGTPVIDYESLSLEAKVANLIGLEISEIEVAVASLIINPLQKFIWTFPSQHKIKTAITDFDKVDGYDGIAPIYLAKSISKYYLGNSQVVAEMMDVINKGEAKLSIIKGLEFLNLMEFRLTTPVKEFSVITKMGPKQEYLIHAIIPCS
ncbi:MAG: hypothetical protein NTY72_14265 [Bacteroidetes bacterium]|nr:hypothetical protein [Bacteroidota bacterium]MCX6300244.1 hypothetical protein [Bacteroidota bacterium]